MTNLKKTQPNNICGEKLDLFLFVSLILKVTIKPYLKLVLKLVSG